LTNPSLFIVLLLWSGPLALAQSPGETKNSNIAEAEALLKRFVALSDAFDSSVADLYSDSAVIKTKRTSGGVTKELSLPAARYKDLIRSAMPVAKARGDRDTLSKCSFRPEGQGVRILCNRYSELKKYDSPLSFLVGAGPAGGWLIFEEMSETRG
jgi:hypothetical protein